MKITLIAVGTKMPAWVTTGFEEYQRRFPKDMPFELIEIPAGKRGKNADIKRILEQEGKAMLAACGKGKVVTLDIPGLSLIHICDRALPSLKFHRLLECTLYQFHV